MKIGYQSPLPEKMSIGWIYSGACCPNCCRPERWKKRGGHNKNHKSKTIRTHRTNSHGKNFKIQIDKRQDF